MIPDDRLKRVDDAMGFAPHQSEPCGRPTRRGTACHAGRNAASARFGPYVFLSPACMTHLTPEEQAERQAVLDLNEAATERAEPACWSWPVSEDCQGERSGFYRFQQGRCAVCGIHDPEMVEDHDHYTGFTRGFLCRSCNVAEGRSYMPIFVKYRERNPASILGIESIYCGPFWEYERDAGKFHGPRPEDRDIWATDTSLRLGL